jgi:hypothetical protein
MKGKRSDVKTIDQLKGKLSGLDTRISNLSFNQTPLKFRSARRNNSLMEELPPLTPRRGDKKNKLSRVFKSLQPGSVKEIEFLEKYFNLPTSTKSSQKSKTKSKLKLFHCRPKILPKATRVDPITNPVLLTEEDLQKGIYSLVNLGLLSKHSEIFDSLSKENPPLMHSKALLHNSSIQLEPLKIPCNSKKKKLNFIFSEPVIQKKLSVVAKVEENLKKTCKILIKDGKIVRNEDFEEFLKDCQNRRVLEILGFLETASKKYGIDEIFVLSENLEVDKGCCCMNDALLLVENKDDVLDVVRSFEDAENLKRLRAQAALKIQCMWRRFKGAARMRRHRLEKSKVRIIEVQYKKYKKKLYTKNFAAKLREDRSNKFSERQEWLKLNWSIFLKTRVEIHIGSNMPSFPTPPNSEIFRLFLLSFPEIKIKYITLQYIDLEIINYYEFLLDILKIPHKGRLDFICPYTLCRNPMNDTSKALYMSSHDLVQLKRATRSEKTVYVPFQTNEFDEYIGDFLKIPIFGCMSSTFQKFSKITRWEVLKKSGLKIVPGTSGNWNFQEFSEKFEEVKKGNQEVCEWKVFLEDAEWDELPWTGFQSVLIQAVFEEVVFCSFLVDPEGKLQESVFVEERGKVYKSFIFPQKILKHLEITENLKVLAGFLYSLNIFGYLSAKFCGVGLIDFEIEANSSLFINVFIRRLVNGLENDGELFVAKQEFSEFEQEVYIDENSNFVVFEDFSKRSLENMQEEKEKRVWVWTPLVFHEDLIGQKVISLFHMCRIENVLFNLSNNEGVAFLPYTSFSSGCLGIVAVASEFEQAFEFLAQALFILIQVTRTGRGNLIQIAEEIGIREKVEQFSKFSEENQFLVKLLK